MALAQLLDAKPWHPKPVRTCPNCARQTYEHVDTQHGHGESYEEWVCSECLHLDYEETT